MSDSKNEVSLAKEGQPDELSLLDLVAIVRRHHLNLLGGALIGGVLGLAVAFVLPAQWEAVVLLRVAQLGEGSAPVEQPLRMAERIKQKSFKDDALRRMGVSQDESNVKAILLRNSLEVKVEKSDLIGVRVRGASPEEAVRFVDAVVAELASVHAKMAEPTIDRWRKELDDVDRVLKQENSEAERLARLLGEQRRSTNNNNLYSVVLASNILLARETTLRALWERKRALQEQLSPDRTSPTAPLGQVEISKQPVFPKKSLFAAGGLAIGLLMVGLLSIFNIAPIWRQKK